MNDLKTQALNIARRHAVAHHPAHTYLPTSEESSRDWLPHEWVVAAIEEALRGGSGDSFTASSHEPMSSLGTLQDAGVVRWPARHTITVAELKAMITPAAPIVYQEGYHFGVDTTNVSSLEERPKFRTPRREFLMLAQQCGAELTLKPDGSEAVTVVFTIPAWQAFDAACLERRSEDWQRRNLGQLYVAPKAITRKVYVGTSEFREMIAARFEIPGERTFLWEGHRWAYRYTSFDDRGNYHLIFRYSDPADTETEGKESQR